MRRIRCCVKIFIGTVLMCILGSSAALAYPEPVAVITNYNQIAEQISVYRANGECEDSYAILYPGDRISGKLDGIAFEFGPYADCATGDGYDVITYAPPSRFEQLADDFWNTFGGMWKSIEDIRMGVSRGPLMELKIYPQPGSMVTILSNQSVHFGWETAQYKTFTIKDEKGKVVVKKQVEQLLGVDLVPKDVGLKMDRKYTWTLDGDYTEYALVVLGAEEEKLLMDHMAAINAKNFPDETKLVQQAAYLQFISDTYPKKLDLYWLSYKMLSNVEMKQEENIKLRDVLLLKCKQHVGYIK